MSLVPLRDTFLFSFLDQTQDGLFIDRSKAGFIMTNKDMDTQAKYPRWAKVLAIGPLVTDFVPGALVLIEQGMWTIGFKYDGVSIWKSDVTKVCAITEDINSTYQF